MKLNMVLVALVLLITSNASAQQVTPILYGGAGGSEVLASGATSTTLVLGAKLNMKIADDGWFTQPLVSVIRVQPTNGAPAWISVQAGALVGYKLDHGKSRLSLYGGATESRNKIGDWLPTAIAGPIVKLGGKWSALGLVSRNSQTWGGSVTFGRAFKPWHK